MAKSVTSEAKRLQKEEFPTARIGILHSKMTKEKKEDVMAEFAHDIDILVATSVVEVGVESSPMQPSSSSKVPNDLVSPSSTNSAVVSSVKPIKRTVICLHERTVTKHVNASTRS